MAPKASGSDTRRLPGQVLVRLTAETAAALAAHAGVRDITAASVARDLIVSGLAELGEPDRRPVPRRTRRPAPAEDIAAVGRLSRWVNRHNGELKELVVALRLAGAADLHATAEGALAECNAVAAELAKVAMKLRQFDGSGET